MTTALQTFLSTATEKAAADLEAAFLRLPEDKRDWRPMGSARTALDMLAECAILSDITEIVRLRALPPDFDFAKFGQAKAALSQDWDALRSLLYANTARAVIAIQTVPDDDMNVSVAMPWGPMTLAQVVSYPYWNMSYHEGQINYIASLLETEQQKG